jgi:hypothetical protein
MPSYNFHGRIVDVLHGWHVYMEKPWISKEEKVDAASLNLATFNGEVLQIPALLVCHSRSETEPLITKLNATSKVKVLDERASLQHDFDESIRGDLLVI